MPSSVSGVIKELRVKPGDKVKVGADDSRRRRGGGRRRAAAGSERQRPKVASAAPTAPVVDEATTEGGQKTEAQVKPGVESTMPHARRQEREQGLGEVGEHEGCEQPAAGAAGAAARLRRKADRPGACSTSTPARAAAVPGRLPSPARAVHRRYARELGWTSARCRAAAPAAASPRTT